ncbi:partial Phytochrome-like protein cph2, partial [Anaerolineae bacterium]
MIDYLHSKLKESVILIVDDVPTNIQVLAEALRMNYRVRVANSAKVAFEVIEKFGAPDLVLLDVMMPDMDGYEVCRHLKQSDKTQHVPIIFVTTKSDVRDEEYGLRLGAVDYITKPFHLPIVLARVQNHINLKIKTDLLESQAMLDGLTNIPNRRRFDEVLQNEWKRASRTGSVLSLIMADIDYFKRYNDYYGHGMGDDCLKRVASAFAESAERPSDLVARYGGEEFVALLPETHIEGANTIAEHFCELVADLSIVHEYSKISHIVTVSLGIASISPKIDHISQENLLRLADRKLYQAKETGRNRICF